MYCVSDDGYRYCYMAEDGELVEKRKIADHEVLGMVHYPNANSMLVFSQKGEIAVWTVLCVCSRNKALPRKEGVSQSLLWGEALVRVQHEALLQEVSELADRVLVF